MRRLLLFNLMAAVIVGLALVAHTQGLVGTIGSAPDYEPTAIPPTPSGMPRSAPGRAVPGDEAPAPPPITAPQRPTGRPAIKPSTPDVAPGAPAFGAQDVITFIQNSGVHGVRIASSGPVAVVRVEFLTGRAADARLQAQTGQPDDALLCLVTLQGSFAVAGPAGIPPRTFTTAFQLYDALTGNLLLQGEIPGAP